MANDSPFKMVEENAQRFVRWIRHFSTRDRRNNHCAFIKMHYYSAFNTETTCLRIWRVIVSRSKHAMVFDLKRYVLSTDVLRRRYRNFFLTTVDGVAKNELIYTDWLYYLHVACTVYMAVTNFKKLSMQQNNDSFSRTKVINTWHGLNTWFRPMAAYRFNVWETKLYI